MPSSVRQTAPHEPRRRSRSRPKAPTPRVRLSWPSLTIASFLNEHPQTGALCTLARGDTRVSSTLAADVFEIQLELQPTASAMPRATTRLHQGPPSAQLDNLLPGTRADAVAHRLQRLELAKHTRRARLAGAPADRAADGAGRGGAEQGRRPNGRFERHRGRAMAVGERGWG